MPPKRAKGRSGLDQLLESAVRLAAYTNAADSGAALPPVRTISELQRDLEALMSFMQEDEMSQLDGFSALEHSPKALAALAQLLSSSLRMVTGASSAAANPPPATATEAAGQRSMAGGKGANAADAQPAQRAERTLSTVCPLLAAYFKAALDCAKCYIPAGVPPGAADLVEVLVRSDFLPAATRLLLAARDDPLRLNAHACDGVSLVNAFANFSRRSDGLLSRFLTSFFNSGFLEVSITAAVNWVIREVTRGSVMLAMLHDVQEMLVEECSQPAAYSRVARVYSGPCLQYWTALQAVSQLHAADGGTLYGLPPAALLPPDWAAEEGRQQRQGRSGGRQQRQRLLRCSGLINSVNSWSWCLDQDHPVPLGPLRPRALRSLALRTARAALASCELHDPGLAGAVEAVRWRGSSGMPQQAQQAAAGSGEGSRRSGVGSSGGGPGGSGSSSSSSGSIRHGGSGRAGGDSALGGRSKSSSGSGSGGSGKGDGSGGGGGSGRSGLPVLRHAFEALDCSTLAIKALALAVETMSTPWKYRVRGHAVVGGNFSSSSSQEYETRTLDVRLRDARFASRWWPLVVQSVWAAMRRPHGLQVLDMLCCRPVLLMLQPWEMLMHHSDSNGGCACGATACWGRVC